MTYGGSLPSIVIGNLAVDVRGLVSTAEGIGKFAQGRDISVDADQVDMMPGGSAWLFAETFSSRRADTALILGCVGKDEAGDFLLSRLDAAALSIAGIDRTELVST